jgi:hypothetical protein
VLALRSEWTHRARFGLAQLLALLGLLAIEQIFKVAHGMTFRRATTLLAFVI